MVWRLTTLLRASVISLPLALGIGVSDWLRDGHMAKVELLRLKLEIFAKLLGERFSFFPTGVAELTECECGIGDSHLPTP